MPSKETIAIGNELVNRWGHLNRQFGLYSGAVFRAILQKQEGREESQWVNVQSVLRFVKRYTGKEFGPTKLTNPEGFVVGSGTVMRSSGMYVVMPNYHSRILEARIDGSRLRVEIDGSSGILVSDLRLVAKATGIPSGPSNGSAHIPFVQDPMTSPLIEQDFGMPLSSANVSLYWKPGQDEEPFVDDQLATKGPFSPQPMISVLEEFDPGLKILLGALTTTRAPHDMEWAVSTVMAMAGFVVEWLGYKGEKIQNLQSEIDLIARVPGELRVVLLEVL